MARPRSIPDTTIHAATRLLMRQGGEKAVAFSAVAAATHLAPASLAQRYGSVNGMIEAAALDGVDQALAALADAEAQAPDKGPQGLLKLLADSAPDAACLAVLTRSAAGRDKLAAFRLGVEAALRRRMGPKLAEEAGAVFALWQGQSLWDDAAAASFKMKDVVRKLG
jgi:AcrR family transcriptional regulator